jgi:hypothetical protein
MDADYRASEHRPLGADRLRMLPDIPPSRNWVVATATPVHRTPC